MKLISVKLPEEMDRRLTKLAKKTARPKSYYLREALTEYLDDIEDESLALERLNDKNARYLSTEELKKKLGL